MTLPSGSKAKVTFLKHQPRPTNALIFCHGFRPKGIPLAAPFAANDNPHKRVYLDLMLKRGFLVASVSYRREGVIYADAVEDIMEMRQWIVNHFGSQGMIIAQGRSMGGAICTLLNERYGDQFAGILTLGAALHVSAEHDGTKPVFSCVPKTKQIFLTNVSELGVIEAYCNKVGDDANLLPRIFQIHRFGHCAVFDSELALGFEKLFAWIEQNDAGAPVLDATDYAAQPAENARQMYQFVSVFLFCSSFFLVISTMFETGCGLRCL